MTIPDSVTTIGDGAFSGCAGLTKVDVKGTLTDIGDGAFDDCTSLTEAPTVSGKSDPTKPTTPTDPTDPLDPVDPTEPTEPDNPTTPDAPSTPTVTPFHTLTGTTSGGTSNTITVTGLSGARTYGYNGAVEVKISDIKSTEDAGKKAMEQLGDSIFTTYAFNISLYDMTKTAIL